MALGPGRLRRPKPAAAFTLATWIGAVTSGLEERADRRRADLLSRCRPLGLTGFRCVAVVGRGCPDERASAMSRARRPLVIVHCKGGASVSAGRSLVVRSANELAERSH